MVKIKDLDRDLTTDITAFPGDRSNQNGWTPLAPSNWNDWSAGIRHTWDGDTTDLFRRSYTPNTSWVGFEFEFDIKLTYTVDPVSANSGVSWKIGGDGLVQAGVSVSYDGVTGGIRWVVWILTSDTGPVYPFLYYESAVAPEVAFPNFASDTWYEFKFKVTKGNYGQAWWRVKGSKVWIKLEDNYDTFNNPPFSREKMFTASKSYSVLDSIWNNSAASSGFSYCSYVKIWRIIDLFPSKFGLEDIDGNNILGYNIDDDGSGSSSGGEGGFGGGGIISQTLTFQAGGYVNAIDSDIRKVVVGGTTGDTGRLISYDNGTRTWEIEPDNIEDLFDVSEAITITDGTGQGTTIGSSTIVVTIGGIDGGSGIVGSGSEGNIDYSNYSGNIGSGDNSAWRGSGSGLNIIGFDYTREFDSVGFASLALDVVNGWSALLNAWKGKKFNITQDGIIIYRGYVTEVHTPDRYTAVLTLHERHHKLNVLETSRDYTKIITDLETNYAVITVVNGDTITIGDADLSNVQVGSQQNGILIIPGDEPAVSNEEFIALDSDTTEGTIAEVNTDDGNYVNSIVATDNVSKIAIISGTYSGTQADIEAIVVKVKLEVHDLFPGNTVRYYLYDYVAADYVQIKTETVAGSYFPIGRTGFETELGRDTLLTKDYVDHLGSKEFKLKITVDNHGAFENIRIHFADFLVYTDPLYNGAYFPIDSKTSSTLTSSVDIEAAGVNVGDTIVVGTRNDLVIAQIIDEFFYDMTVDVDSNFLGYTNSNFFENHTLAFVAIQSVLKKEQGFMYYRPDTDTLYFKKKVNLINQNIILSNSTFKGGDVQVRIDEAQNKQQDEYRRTEVTGNNYRRFDKNTKPVFARSEDTGFQTNRVLRINDPTLNSETECRQRADSEKLLLEESNLVFEVKIINIEDIEEIDFSSIYPGTKVQVQYHGTLYDAMPIKMMQGVNVERDRILTLHIGWKGTTYEDRQQDEINQLRTEVRLLQAGMGIKPAGDLIGLIAKHRHRLDFFNGIFTESFDALVTSNGTTVTMSLEKSGTGDLTMNFSDGETELDCTPALTIALTAGTDTAPQVNYIYILKSTKVLTKSTSNWPSSEHIKISYLFIPSASKVQSMGGGMINQNWNDHAWDQNNGSGHLVHITKRMRRSGALYFSGIDPAGSTSYLTISGSNVYFKSGSGIISQMHEHTFPAIDTETSDHVHVVNDNAAPYTSGSDLYALIPNDSTGTAIGNNKYFNLIFWGVANKTGEHELVMVNLPAGTYNNQTNAENDVDKYDDYSMPREFYIDSSTGFYICKITLMKSGSAWVWKSTTDLRGRSPFALAGAAGGGGIVPLTEFSDGQFKLFNTTDPTKIIDFLLSGISTGTVRTKTVQDTNGILAEMTDVQGIATQHSDISDAGSGIIISAAERTALHAIYVLTKAAVDALLITELGTVTVGNIDAIANYIANTVFDEDAIHNNVANEINALTPKTPIPADWLMVEDTVDSFAKKKVSIAELPVTDPDAIHDDTANEISAIVEKAVPVAGDLFIIEDSAAGNIKKRVQMSYIDHDALRNFVANEHLLPAAIDHDALTNFEADEHKLEAAIDHDALTNFESGEHFTMLNEDDMVSDSDTQTTTQQAAKAYIDEINMIGSVNSAWSPMAYGLKQAGMWEDIGSGYMRNPGTTPGNGWMQFVLILPTVKGSLKLKVKGLRIIINDADFVSGGNFIDRVIMRRMSDTVNTAMLDDGTNRTTQGTFDYPFTAVDVSAEDNVIVEINFTITVAFNLDFTFPAADVYYET